MESTKDTFKRDGHLQSRHVCVGMSPEPVTVGDGEACEHVKVTMQKDHSSRNLARHTREHASGGVSPVA